MYKPYLLHRVNFRYNELKRGQGLQELVDYAYMGSAEYEFGAVGQSLDRVMQDLLRKTPYSLVALDCMPSRYSVALESSDAPYAQGQRLYALLRTVALEAIGGPDALSAGLQAVMDGSIRLKEPMMERGPHCMWHDLRNDIFFSPNANFLRLVHSVLGRDPGYSFEIDNELRIGDPVTLATTINGRSYKSIRGMDIKSGKVCALLQNRVTCETEEGKRYHMPYVYMLDQVLPIANLQKEMQNDQQ